MSRMLPILIAALAFPAAASARVTWFHSPSGNIQCEVASHDSRGDYAYCQTFNPVESVKLGLDGHSKICRGGSCVGDGPQNAFTLRYGHSVHVGPFTCTSSTSGMRCHVGRHGFAISRRGISRF